MNLPHKIPTIPVKTPSLPRDETALAASIRGRLQRLYPPDVALSLADELVRLAGFYREHVPAAAGGWSERDALLITYGDTIQEAGRAPLVALKTFLREQLGPVISLVHLLPQFPFSSDDGFSIIDYRQVRPELGSWSDIAKLAECYRLVFDAVVNHASQQSSYMRGHCSGDPDYTGFAVVVPAGTDTSKVLRTRDLPLLHAFETVRGRELLWTTFSADQVDLNFRNPRVLVEMTDVLFFYAQQGAAVLRLDAIPYLWKEIGTSCAHLPQTHEIIKLWRDLFDLAAPHVLILTETNVPHRENVSYFGNGRDEAQIIYNFSLPPLLLWTLHAGDAALLTRWAASLDYIGPRATYLNLTASHDGIGMRPTEDLLSAAQREELCALARRHGGEITGKRNADGSISVYELNLTYFDALNDPQGPRPLDMQIDRFVLSQAVTMALAGIPAFYLPALLGSRNDAGLVRRTGRARSINRPSFDAAALAQELAQPGSLRTRVLTRLKHLLQLRATLSPFHPDSAQEILDLGAALFVIRRTHRESGQVIVAVHNVTETSVPFPLPAGVWRELIANRDATGSVTLAPYAIGWWVRV